MSLVRALWGHVYPQLRSASIEASEDGQEIFVRFEYDGIPDESAQEACEIAATEVIADFPSVAHIHVEHCPSPQPTQVNPLRNLVFLRGE